MVSFRTLLLAAVLFCSVLFAGCLLNLEPVTATPEDPVFIRHSVLPAAPNGPSLFAPCDPVANYDEQLGLTFTEDFSSLAYNVTALALTNDYDVGPAYLLNGLTSAGYWYQVGISYNWPYTSGGHVNGFYLSYNVFNSAGSVVLPSSGAGGIKAFSGPVYSGDLILLSLNFTGGNVIMYAKDWNTGASSSVSYSARGSTVFVGLPDSPSNANGFFSGLMTEWYHVLPYYGDMTAITYTNYAFNLSSAWVWMDEWNPSNPSWSGSWFDYELVDYTSDPSSLQKLSSHGATVFSNASTFITGSIGMLGTETTTITLLPAGNSAVLSSTNQFTVTYTLNNVVLTTQTQNATLNLICDVNTSIIVSGTSTGSTTQEKWVLNTNGNPVFFTSGTNVTLYYYDLLAQSTSFAVVGGGNPQNPVVTYATAPFNASGQASSQAVSLILLPSQQTLWALRGSTVSVVNPLSSSSSEQWITPTSLWAITQTNQLPQQIIYTHQFLLTVSGAQVSPQWYNSGATAQLSIAGATSRASGAGQRVTSYSVDGSALTTVQPTTGMITISVLMNTAHQVQVNAIKQYQITLDSQAAKTLASITSPTISGDNYWYDEGTSVKLSLNSVVGRLAGKGERLVSYSVNGAETQVSTSTPVTVLNIGSLSNSQAISATTTTQFQLSTPSGSIESITSPPIASDAGWYDAETSVTIAYNYSWNMTTAPSRVNAISYTISQGAATLLDRSANGTFVVQVTITKPESIHITSVTQYRLGLSGGYNVILSQDSPTGDLYFDLGTTLTATTPYVWGLTDGNKRQSLNAYTLDGVTFSLPRAETGSFTTPTLTFDGVHEVAFRSVAQHLVTFQFKDNQGANPLTPDMLQLETIDATIIDVPLFAAWFDNGTQFQIHSILWQNLDVKPTSQTSYIVTATINDVLHCRVFNAEIAVVDYLGIPVGGADISVTLANGTVINRVTANDGTVNLQMIPLGTFNAEISYLGTSTTVAGDASAQTVTTGSVFSSIPTFALIAVVVIAAVAVVVVVFIRRHNRLVDAKLP